MRRRSHVHGGSGETARGEWCTPAWLAAALGKFDLDPCSNSRSHVRAARKISLAYGDDGLCAERARRLAPSARVFLNPPYERGSIARWYRAYAHTRWCFLLRFDPSTSWFAEIYGAAELVCVPRGRRVNFEPPPGVKASSSTFPHALYYRRVEDATEAILRYCISWRPSS